jgi:hypothetical protein
MKRILRVETRMIEGVAVQVKICAPSRSKPRGPFARATTRRHLSASPVQRAVARWVKERGIEE